MRVRVRVFFERSHIPTQILIGLQNLLLGKTRKRKEEKKNKCDASLWKQEMEPSYQVSISQGRALVMHEAVYFTSLMASAFHFHAAA